MRPLAVVDASVAVKWFVPESRSADAHDLMSVPRLIAPTLIRTEVASALSKKARARLVTVEHATEYLAVLPRFFNELVETSELLGAALVMANEIGHPIYDCIYIETAKRRNTLMVTDDLRLIEKLEHSAWASLAVALADWKTALA